MSLNLPKIELKKAPEAEEGFKPDYLYKDKDEIIHELKSGKRIFGTPAASLTWGIDGNNNDVINAGIEGEKMTAKVLAELAKDYPHMFVFHSLSWPTSNGDTDHIVVWGNMLIVVDSKRWKATRKYSVTANGDILRGTVHFPEGKVKIAYALKSWRNKLKDIRIIGAVCIAQEKVFVTRDRNWYRAPYKLVEVDKLRDYLEQTFTDNPIINPTKASLLIYLCELLVKPRNRRNELIRTDGLDR